MGHLEHHPDEIQSAHRPLAVGVPERTSAAWLTPPGTLPGVPGARRTWRRRCEGSSAAWLKRPGAHSGVPGPGRTWPGRCEATGVTRHAALDQEPVAHARMHPTSFRPDRFAARDSRTEQSPPTHPPILFATGDRVPRSSGARGSNKVLAAEHRTALVKECILVEEIKKELPACYNRLVAERGKCRLLGTRLRRERRRASFWSARSVANACQAA